MHSTPKKRDKLKALQNVAVPHDATTKRGGGINKELAIFENIIKSEDTRYADRYSLGEPSVEVKARLGPALYAEALESGMYWERNEMTYSRREKVDGRMQKVTDEWDAKKKDKVSGEAAAESFIQFAVTAVGHNKFWDEAAITAKVVTSGPASSSARPAVADIDIDTALSINQAAYSSKCTQLANSLREGCSRLLKLVPTDSIQATVTRERVAAARTLEPITLKLENYVTIEPEGRALL